MRLFVIIPLLIIALSVNAQDPSQRDSVIEKLIEAVDATRIEADIRKLAGFGTRHTLSDTISQTRGIGAARRWIYNEFQAISSACGGCLEVYYQYNHVPAGDYPRIPEGAIVVNVIAILRGTDHPNRYIAMTGDIDSRVSDILDHTSDNPGANDNASGMAGVLEAARILTKSRYRNSILFAGLSGEEQGLVGGKFLAQKAQAEGWEFLGVLNNDMIGNTTGINGTKNNRSFRLFSEPVPVNMNDQQREWYRFYGGEVDGPSRQLARYIDHHVRIYMPDMQPMMVYRLDRFGRGGHHKPFNDAGFPAVRVMETYEHYDHQHQDIRVENGRQYGDLIQYVDFEYAARLTAVNIIALATIGHSPSPPQQIMIGGIVSPSTRLQWIIPEDENVQGFKIYWRDTTSPQWQYFRYAGLTDHIELENVIIDNYLFGVASISKDGYESIIQYPLTLIPRGQ